MFVNVYIYLKKNFINIFRSDFFGLKRAEIGNDILLNPTPWLAALACARPAFDSCADEDTLASRWADFIHATNYFVLSHTMLNRSFSRFILRTVLYVLSYRVFVEPTVSNDFFPKDVCCDSLQNSFLSDWTKTFLSKVLDT